MDAFFAAIEQRDDASLRGRPVVVGGTSSRGVVAAASYEARPYGVRSAMPTAQARRLCPHAVFLQGDLRRYRRESRRIFEIFGHYSPLVEPLSLDEAFLDMSGTERLLGEPVRVAERLRAEVRRETGLTVSVGIAPVKMVAKIASDLAKPDGLRVVGPSEVGAFLAPLAVRSIWGIGPVAGERLASAGIHTVGDLARIEEGSLKGAVGPFAIALSRLARGEDPRRVEPDREPKTIGEENTFPRDVVDLGTLETALRVHAEAVARRLRRAGLRARGVRIKVKLAKRLGGGRFPLLTRSRRLEAPTDDGPSLSRVACDLLREIPSGEPVRLVGIAAEGLVPADGRQLTLLPPSEEEIRRRALNLALDRLEERFGANAPVRGRPGLSRAGLSVGVKRGEE